MKLLLLLLLLVPLSFWLSPAPQGPPDVEYWGEYVQVAPGLGFVHNHDSEGYVAVARYPGQLLQPGEVRQSRPLYPLLAAALGYPLAAALRLAHRLGLTPAAWPEWDDEATFWGYYWAYVLLNALTLLGSLLLLRRLVRVYAGPGGEWLELPLAWILLATPVTKAFFWTAHQQMLAFFVPLLCLALALQVARLAGLGWRPLAALSLALGLLPLVYGSFVLAWPALALGQWRATRPQALGWHRRLGQLAGSAALFGLPTLAWVGMLHLHGTTYYNHEAVRFHQFTWLWEARHLPPADYLRLVGSKLTEYVGSLGEVGGWLAAGLALLLATWARGSRPVLPPRPGWLLAALLALFGGFFGLLGYYPARLAYVLLPLGLVLVAGLLPHWSRRYAQPLLLAVAAGWHLYVLLSYGPFS